MISAQSTFLGIVLTLFITLAGILVGVTINYFISSRKVNKSNKADIISTKASININIPANLPEYIKVIARRGYEGDIDALISLPDALKAYLDLELLKAKSLPSNEEYRASWQAVNQLLEGILNAR